MPEMAQQQVPSKNALQAKNLSVHFPSMCICPITRSSNSDYVWRLRALRDHRDFNQSFKRKPPLMSAAFAPLPGISK